MFFLPFLIGCPWVSSGLRSFDVFFTGTCPVSEVGHGHVEAGLSSHSLNSRFLCLLYVCVHVVMHFHMCSHIALCMFVLLYNSINVLCVFIWFYIVSYCSILISQEMV